MIAPAIDETGQSDTSGKLPGQPALSVPSDLDNRIRASRKMLFLQRQRDSMHPGIAVIQVDRV